MHCNGNNINFNNPYELFFVVFIACVRCLPDHINPKGWH